VLATWYEEIVVDRLYNGKTQLPKSFQELVLTAEQVLEYVYFYDLRGGGVETEFKEDNQVMGQGIQLDPSIGLQSVFQPLLPSDLEAQFLAERLFDIAGLVDWLADIA
jgi:hypothetical protein